MQHAPLTAAAVVFLLLGTHAPAVSQSRSTTPQQTAPEAAPAHAVPLEQDVDAHDLRARFEGVLARQPPSLRVVLRADPSLLDDANYLATYPELARFVATYPQVRRDARFFVGNPQDEWRPGDRSVQLWKELLEGLSVLSVVSVVTLGIVWMIRTALDHRRWLRVSKVQADVHQKVIDRLASNDELLRYVQTPSGQRFLDSAPIALDTPRGAGVSAPVSRILWSLQTGVVLLAGGIGCHWISGRVVDDARQLLAFLGVMGIALGLGFVASALAAYVVSARLGLLRAEPGAAPPSSPGHA